MKPAHRPHGSPQTSKRPMEDAAEAVHEAPPPAFRGPLGPGEGAVQGRVALAQAGAQSPREPAVAGEKGEADGDEQDALQAWEKQTEHAEQDESQAQSDGERPPHAAEAMRYHSSSVRIGTPSSRARRYLLPGSRPTIT